MGSASMIINVDDNGHFLGVTMGGVTYSPDAWNAMFEKLDPQSGSPTNTTPYKTEVD